MHFRIFLNELATVIKLHDSLNDTKRLYIVIEFYEMQCKSTDNTLPGLKQLKCAIVLLMYEHLILIVCLTNATDTGKKCRKERIN